MYINIYVIYVYISSKIVCHSVSLPGAQFAEGSVSSWDTGNMISITFHQASPIMASFSMDNNCHILPWVVPFALGSLEKKQWTKRNSWDMRFTIKQSACAWFRPHPWFFSIWDSDWNDHFAHHFRAKKNGFPVQSLSPDPKNLMGPMGLWRHWPQVPAREHVRKVRFFAQEMAGSSVSIWDDGPPTLRNRKIWPTTWDMSLWHCFSVGLGGTSGFNLSTFDFRQKIQAILQSLIAWLSRPFIGCTSN